MRDLDYICYRRAECIRLVLNNLSTHSADTIYRLWGRRSTRGAASSRVPPRPQARERGQYGRARTACLPANVSLGPSTNFTRRVAETVA